MEGLAMPLMLTCRNCHKPFLAGIQMDQKSFQDPSNQLINNSEQCSNCHKSATYNKKDYRWQP
jgi:nitrate/TMAO reductase-like tetraheme cytochrome c subunit